MKKHVVILGGGFGGLQVASRLSDAIAEQVEVTLIDKSDGFVFGFNKFELMLGRATLADVTFPYREIRKPGVTFRQETVTKIDPAAKRVTTDRGIYDADILVVALGADYNVAGTPGFAEGGHEFYSVTGAIAMKDVLPTFRSGSLVIGIIGQPFKCPPAPCEAAILLDEYYEQLGVRKDIEITVVSQWSVPIPPSPDGTKEILSKFKERNISFVTETVITALDPANKKALLKSGGSIPYDLFLGVPLHRVPAVVQESGLAENGWVPVSEKNLSTKFPGVYAVGDVTSAPVPKAGVFAESAADAVADHLIAEITGSGEPEPFNGRGSCYVEFGNGLVGRMDANFFPGTRPTAPFSGPSVAVARQKDEFSAERRRRWLGV
jgi:sulfide:quinone oxidoreductase